VSQFLLSQVCRPNACSFVKFYDLLDNRVVTEFSYRMSQGHTGHIICSFLLRSSPSSASGPSPAERTKEIGDVIKSLNDHGIEASDLSENEFAKSHVRHLVGGRGAVDNERLFRFGTSSLTGGLGCTLMTRIPREIRCIGQLSSWTETRLEYLPLPLP